MHVKEDLCVEPETILAEVVVAVFFTGLPGEELSRKRFCRITAEFFSERRGDQDWRWHSRQLLARPLLQSLSRSFQRKAFAISGDALMKGSPVAGKGWN